jgi:NAD(P)-dependent dehydrogenase (short-subunit alcohol dehydrogenase family)
MRILVIGGTGTIGSAVAEALGPRHEVVPVGHSTGDLQVDITSKASIEGLFDAAGPFDALVSAAGAGRFKPLAELTDDDFQASLGDKLMGQVNLVRLGLERVADGGSITLTSGTLAQNPMVGGAAISLVNAALEGFARAAALEAPRKVRVNVVSPPWVSETLVSMGRDGSSGLPAATVARAYVESVEGRRTGQVLAAEDFA